MLFLLVRTDMSTLQLSLLVLVLCILSVSAQLDFLSIDCGSSSASYRDGNLIDWRGDGNYISTGESRVVPSRNSISRVMNSLRVFSNGQNKNCYNINMVNQGRVLLRASFYYGNYDDRSRPPSFDLQFDGNHWAEVETSSSGYVYYEVIYSMKRDSISVCVAQTRRNEFPFISALEIRGLESPMYDDYVNETLPLFLYKRTAFGINTNFIRYGDDPYDRIWTPGTVGNGYTVLTGNETFPGALPPHDPPPVILQNALTSIRPNSSMILPTGLLPSKVYFNWYFTEVARLGPNDTRSFIISMNGEDSIPIEPPFRNCSQWYGWTANVTTNYTVSLIPTNVSTLSPLINAMEVFAIGDELTDGTDKDDVQGLSSLQNAFSVLEGWTGDPCLPATFNWEWIECSNDTEPRVTALLLGSFGLTGQLPDFGSMDALRTIDLHNNSLSGPIPNFLGSLSDLTQLNLADNQFTGSIPASLTRRSGLNLVVTGNTGLCTPSNSSCATSTSPPAPPPRNPTNISASNKLKNYLPIMFDTAIASFTVIWFIMY